MWGAYPSIFVVQGDLIVMPISARLVRVTRRGLSFAAVAELSGIGQSRSPRTPSTTCRRSRRRGESLPRLPVVPPLENPALTQGGEHDGLFPVCDRPVCPSRLHRPVRPRQRDLQELKRQGDQRAADAKRIIALLEALTR